MRNLRIALWGLVVLVAGILAWATFGGQDQNSPRLASAAYGGPFTAMLVDGETEKQISRADIMGRPHIMFFGFTHCPDVCPTTLYEASQWLAGLGTDGDDLDVYFVTVDPERDDAQTLRDYLRAFDPRIKAITGTEEQIAELVSGWNVYAKKAPLEDGDYNVDHTASTFLMRRDGTLQGTIAYQEQMDTALVKLKRLIGA